MSKADRIMIFSLIVSFFLVLLPAVVPGADGPRTIAITATKNEKFIVQGQKEPTITAKPGEVLHLVITAEKGPEFEKDGTVHDFTIQELKDQGWNLRLKEGKNEFTVVAPDKPGEYVAECTVKCGPKHETMKAKLVVKP